MDAKYVPIVIRSRPLQPLSLRTAVDRCCVDGTVSLPLYYAVVTTMIRLRFDGRSTAYQRT